jgi:hypothetical protein
MHAYRIHHMVHLLLKNKEQRIIKEYCNLEDEIISRFLSSSKSLEHSLNEIDIDWNDGKYLKIDKGTLSKNV